MRRRRWVWIPSGCSIQHHMGRELAGGQCGLSIARLLHQPKITPIERPHLRRTTDTMARHALLALDPGARKQRHADVRTLDPGRRSAAGCQRARSPGPPAGWAGRWPGLRARPLRWASRAACREWFPGPGRRLAGCPASARAMDSPDQACHRVFEALVVQIRRLQHAEVAGLARCGPQRGTGEPGCVRLPWIADRQSQSLGLPIGFRVTRSWIAVGDTA